MSALGNARVNAIYEYEIPEYVKKPTPNTGRLVNPSLTRCVRGLITYSATVYVLVAWVHAHMRSLLMLNVRGAYV